MTAFIDTYLSRDPVLAAAPIVRRGRGNYHLRRSDGQVEAHCFGTPIHYRGDSSSPWLMIDTALIDYGEYFASTEGVPIRIEKNGTVVNVGGGWTQRMIAAGTFDPTTGEFKPLWDIPLGQIEDNALVIRTSAVDYRMEIMPDGFRERLVLNVPPKGNLKNLWVGIKTEVSNIFNSGVLEEFAQDGYYFPIPHAWDAIGDLPCQRWADQIQGVQYLYTAIPASALATAVYPVIIDPDYTGSTADGRVYGRDTTYATARSTCFSHNTTTAGAAVGQLSGVNYQCSRVFLKFDTSGIPDTATITQVNLKLYVDSDNSDTDFDVQIVKQDWSGSDPLSSSNRETAFDGCLAGTADTNIWQNTNGLVAGTQYTSGNLATDWPSKTGNTYYSLRSSRDFDNTTPTGDEYITLRLADHATDKPVLAVVYSEVAAALPRRPLDGPVYGPLRGSVR